MHDPTLERVWASPLAVADSTLAELRAVQVEEHRIVTLDEALDCVELPVMVDFTLADVVEPALAVIRGAEALDRVLFGRERRRSPPGACARAGRADRAHLDWTASRRP